MPLRDFDFDFDTYLCSFLTHIHARWCQTSYTLKPATFSCSFVNYVCPFVTTRHERVKNCSIWSLVPRDFFLVDVLSESINRPVSNDRNPIVLLFWFRSQEQLRNNSHTDWWLSVCVILFLCTITDIKTHNAH